MKTVANIFSRTKPFFALILSLIAGDLCFAATNLTIGCKIESVADRINESRNPSISFDADKGYQTLVFEVYGSEVNVSAESYLTSDGKISAHRVGTICVSLAGSQFCTSDPKAVMYPTNKYAQPGDRTTMSCGLSEGVKTLP